MTLEEQIAQLNARIEALLPAHRAAWEAWVPARQEDMRLRKVYYRIAHEIRVCQEAIVALESELEPCAMDAETYHAP